MSLRWRIALALAALTLLATAAVGAASYRSTRDRLYAEVDRSLREVEPRDLRPRPEARPFPERGPLGSFVVQLIDANGTVQRSTEPTPIEPSAAARRVVGHPGVDLFETVDGSGSSLRMRTVGAPDGALQVGRAFGETERVLRSLRARTLLLSLVVAGAAIALGLWIAGRVTRPLRRLTAAAEHVEATGQLDAKVRIDGDDEIARLGGAFDRMLLALARSKDEQQRLVQDAGHELRTPLTSLRTNLDTLRRYRELPDADRDAIVGDLRAETEELTELVNELVAVASGDHGDEPREEFDLCELARETASRFERRTGRSIVVEGGASSVVAQRGGVQRAISCLIDNARKFDAGEAPIEVSVSRGEVSVADRGPGIPAAELELVFERFHRTEEARAMPGSGLGLSIVRDIAKRHGGTVFARNRDGGGAVVGFRLPS